MNFGNKQKKVAFLLSQPNTSGKKTKQNKTRKKSKKKQQHGTGKHCLQRFRSTTSHRFTYLSDVWPIAGCPRVVFAVDPVAAAGIFCTPCHYAQRCDTTAQTQTMLGSDFAELLKHRRPCVPPVVSRLANTEWGVTGGASSCCWTAACEAQRLWDTSACSATAALIMAETLTVCCLSMLGPHFHSHYLQYPKPLTFLCLVRRRGFSIFL